MFHQVARCRLPGAAAVRLLGLAPASTRSVGAPCQRCCSSAVEDGAGFSQEDLKVLDVHPSRASLPEHAMFAAAKVRKIAPQAKSKVVPHYRRADKGRSSTDDAEDTSLAFMKLRFPTADRTTYRVMGPILAAVQQVKKDPDMVIYIAAVRWVLQVRKADGIPDAFRFIDDIKALGLSPPSELYALAIGACSGDKVAFDTVLRRLDSESMEYDRPVLGALLRQGAPRASLEEIWPLYKQYTALPVATPEERKAEMEGKNSVVIAVLSTAKNIQDVLRVLKDIRTRHGVVHMKYIEHGLYCSSGSLTDMQRHNGVLVRENIFDRHTTHNISHLLIKKAFDTNDFMGAKAIFQRRDKTPRVYRAMILGVARLVEDTHDGYALLLSDLLKDARRAKLHLSELYADVADALRHLPDTTLCATYTRHSSAAYAAEQGGHGQWGD
eukprot:TRINITY_DN32188_c0_g1_i1.p1 TRINITY_DN32188_c0_g1~~TRINITY_DN32188_c0_g1_i1.p1  ORF type:complete len:439 (+),score=110.50 TRINITY_DN32188_c0_g1_i1:114-1430(+)